MKSLLLSLSMFFLIIIPSFGEDYRFANDNPFAVYHYNPSAELVPEQNNNTNNVNYFSNTIKNPMYYVNSAKNEYQHLFNNASSMQGCWDSAGKTYGVDPWLLMAVAKVESSFKANAINKNKNNSYDIGMMQINSFWLPTLAKYGISSKDLLNPCTSVFVGSWIMAQNIKRFGFNQDGIGAYNSPGNITIRRRYAQAVYKAYSKLVNDFRQ
jgi:soluble lytic murein transglycosylase-like protein